MSRITQFFSRSRAYDDLSREIRQHLREKTEALVEAGMTRDDAERAARRAFGNVTAIEEEAHDAWGWRWLEDFVFDVGETAERVQFSIVTSSFLSLLGVQPVLGRNFSPSEDAPGGAKVFIASHPLWTRLLGGDPQAIGKSFRLDGEPYRLIGVAPIDFRFPSGCDVWTSIGTLGASSLTDRVSHQFWTLGRLRSGVTVAQAQAQLDVIQQRLADHYPATDAKWHVLVRPLLDDVVGNVRT